MFKTITFTVMHITIAFLVAYLLTGSVLIGGAMATIEPICNSFGYYFHERIWERHRTHKQKLIPAQLL